VCGPGNLKEKKNEDSLFFLEKNGKMVVIDE
jgi:hypothetical protein